MKGVHFFYIFMRKRRFLPLKVNLMLFSPVSVFLGLANLTYACLNLQLLKGLGNLVRRKSSNQSSASVNQAPSIPNTPTIPSVTVLIAARNEELRITKCLDCLMIQDYDPSRLQIIIVDDRSEDGTAAVLKTYSERWPGRLTLVTVTETSSHTSPKKFALARGLEQATGEIVVTTDADCIMSKAWISSLVTEFSEDTGLVLGMTSYYSMGKEDWAWGSQALEFISYGVVAAGLVGLHFPVHGNANNIAYRRRAYAEAAGFASHSNIVSGDDDFLIQSIHKLGRWKIRYSVHPESQVQTEPPLSMGLFWEQRKRWASKCSLYEPKQTAFLAVIFGYYSLIPACMLLGLFDRPYLYLGLVSFGVKTGTDYLVMRKGLGIFSKQELMQWFPVTCLIHIPLIIGAVLAGSFGEFTWKGQRVRRKV